MARSTHHPDYQALLNLLRELRDRAAMTQAELAKSLGNTQTFISKVERGERRIDVVEFTEICEALGFEPTSAFQEFLRLRASSIGQRGKLKRL